MVIKTGFYKTPLHLPSSTASLARAILQTVIYADIFDYPLTGDEIWRYLTDLAAPLEDVLAQLERMSGPGGSLRRVDAYYMLAGRETIRELRAQREKVAARLWPEARRYGQMIARLPFVCMVAVTGSLAMNNTAGDGDIDYLIVSTRGRLWSCRLFVLAVVKLAALRGLNLCPNYLVSESCLEIAPRSLYAAHEFTQMVPLAGPEVYRELLRLNPWTLGYLPNALPLPMAGIAPIHPSRPIEALLRSAPGARLEQWEMERKIRKLSRENSGNPEAVFSPDQCKGHSNRHGWRTEKFLNERLNRLDVEFEK